jgi:hypothetical protein
MLAGIEFVAEHCRDGNARLADSRFWQTSEKINEYKKNDRFLYQDDTLLKKKKEMIPFPPRCVSFISLDGFIQSELGDGCFW